MFSRRHLTLLTDFGERDGYVGILKGAIAKIEPSLAVTDISHEIPPQDILAARFCLANAYPFFPKETVHIAVVDPGVGTSRRGVAIQLEDGFLIGPDNGIFDGVLRQHQEKILAAVELTEVKYWRTPEPSQTFHARDIFATVGAHVATGVRVDRLGVAIDPKSLTRLSLPDPQWHGQQVSGVIQYCDRFGNLITNIPSDDLAGKSWHVAAASRQIPQGDSYMSAKENDVVAIASRHGWLELGAYQRSAQELLGLTVGDSLTVVLS
ncbi:SAM-dependent chlorinase/fluorinase [Phormidium yuhuli AB48]|uniref:SAM-dependent chlorinase/fluorinase n=1 Tax=Phormidium yuhuli AB48 TaxID=2940671 RepID=A0ABY5AWG9_9CYAN|nr:SAM-dependent chlorinase/fluorinase [Phormidium yuhuli]USR92559.1 SAM-dependent chlorinase/fluorinase [Phormidium yuhuli AB48]